MSTLSLFLLLWLGLSVVTATVLGAVIHYRERQVSR